MAGRGPAPKDPSRRVRRNSGGAMRVIEAAPSPQPALPARFKPKSDEEGSWNDEIGWPVATEQWWQMWGESPLASDFTDTDWAELMIAAFLHAEFMEGNVKIAGELRLRTAKFGATPEDRARLKIQFAAADEAEERTEKRRGAKKPAGDDPRLRLVQ